jgi:hypothetical protein
MAKAEKKAEAKQEKPAPVVDTSPKEPPTNAGPLELVPYKGNNIVEFGNKFMFTLVAAAGAEEEAQKMLAAAGEAKQYLSFEMEEKFQIQHALGANQAPLTARAHFILRRLRAQAIEV